MRLLLIASLGIFSMGCAEKQAADPGELVRAEGHFLDHPSSRSAEGGRETVSRIAPPSYDTSRTVRVGCDDDGLHIKAPPGSKVTVPDDATHDAEAQIVLPYDGEGRPIRVTKSLGYIGDAPLTQTPSRGGPWNVPDALLPQHPHHEPRYGISGGYYGAPRYSHGYAQSPSYSQRSTPAMSGGGVGGGSPPRMAPSHGSTSSPRPMYR